ncbi:MAG: hypothetical protein GX591_18255 [Planctomycetes bacterium]|nr:hypothetical protein [Planctomycetota bacterium]
MTLRQHLAIALAAWMTMTATAGGGEVLAPGAPPLPQWHGYDGHWYALTLTGGDWAAVRAEAAAYGATLVAIDSAAENDWLVETFGDQWLWIGLRQARGAGEPAGGWHWENRIDTGYRNWAPRQPDNRSAGDDYAMINVEGDLGRWHDVTAAGWPPEAPHKRGIMEREAFGGGDTTADLEVRFPIARDAPAAPCRAAVRGFEIAGATFESAGGGPRLAVDVRFTRRTATTAIVDLALLDPAGRALASAYRAESLGPEAWLGNICRGAPLDERWNELRTLRFNLPAEACRQAETVGIRVALLTGPAAWDLASSGLLDATGRACAVGDGAVDVDLDDGGACPAGLGSLAGGAEPVRSIRLTSTRPSGPYWLYVRWTPGSSGETQFAVRVDDRRAGTSRPVKAVEQPCAAIDEVFPLDLPPGRATVVLEQLSGDSLRFERLALIPPLRLTLLERFRDGGTLGFDMTAGAAGLRFALDGRAGSPTRGRWYLGASHPTHDGAVLLPRDGPAEQALRRILRDWLAQHFTAAQLEQLVADRWSDRGNEDRLRSDAALIHARLENLPLPAEPR